MAREGRNFEEVVKLIEETIAVENVKVKSPDYILDKDTGQPREVDISLRGKIGSSNILVIIECRDQMKHPPQDVTWIEQITCKRKSVSADKLIAVSSNGFTEPAKIKARKNEIELRTFDEIDPEEIHRWFLTSGNIYHNIQMKTVSIVNINLKKKTKKKIEFPDEIVNWQAPIFVIKKEGKSVSLDFIWSLFAEEIYSGVPEDGSKIHKSKIRINIPNIQLSTKSGRIELKSLDFLDVNLWIQAKKIDPTFTRAYKKGTETLAEIQEFELDVEKEKLILDFCGSETSGRHGVSARIKKSSN
jgi:hypothetical protein